MLIAEETGRRSDLTEMTKPMSITQMCQMVSVSRSGYYHFRWSRFEADPDLDFRNQIQEITLEMPSYGYRRVTHELRRRGVRVNHKKVLHLMRKDNLLCLRKRKFLRTTDSQHGFKVYPNLVTDLVVNDVSQLWVADITYIRLLREFVYLAVILDAFSRRCIGWSLWRSERHGGRTDSNSLTDGSIETKIPPWVDPPFGSWGSIRINRIHRFAKRA